VVIGRRLDLGGRDARPHIKSCASAVGHVPPAQSRIKEKCIGPSLGVLREAKDSASSGRQVVIGRRLGLGGRNVRPHTNRARPFKKPRRALQGDKQIPRRSRRASAPRAARNDKDIGHRFGTTESCASQVVPSQTRGGAS
jgi:hypothetical protein